MTSAKFPLLESDGPSAWIARVGIELATGPADRTHMFGGAGLALSVMALEQLSGRAALWTSVQFVAVLPVPATLGFQGRMLGGGKAIAHAEMRATSGADLILAALGSFGSEPGTVQQWAGMPDAPPPLACEEITAHRDADRDIHASLEIRHIRGRFGIFSRASAQPGGRVQVWMRHRRRPNDRIALAFMSDFIPSTVGNAIGVRAGGNSLDNNIRYCGHAETDWVLGDFAITAVVGGIGHGQAELFAQDGTLLATASQTFKLRIIPAG